MSVCEIFILFQQYCSVTACLPLNHIATRPHIFYCRSSCHGKFPIFLLRLEVSSSKCHSRCCCDLGCLPVWSWRIQVWGFFFDNDAVRSQGVCSRVTLCNKVYLYMGHLHRGNFVLFQKFPFIPAECIKVITTVINVYS